LRDPLASDIFFSIAAAGLKNIWENLDQGTDPKRIVVVKIYKIRVRIDQVELPLA
tara:strand:- start:66 stop:230 length:165 start_codon:yes stop_codon:yes gene_type:complete